MSARSPIDRTFDAERLSIFSDGVMAVAITVLVLDLKLPEGMDPAQLQAALGTLAHAFWCYVLSFLVIGLLWMAHHGQFAQIERVDPVVMWLNLLFLMAVALIPFVTSLMSDYGGPLPTMLYAVALMVSCLSLAAMWWYACRNPKLVSKSVPEELRRAGVIAPLLVALVFAASIAVGYGAGATAAQWTWVLAALAGPLADRLSRA